jgi:hypothetical protein
VCKALTAAGLGGPAPPLPQLCSADLLNILALRCPELVPASEVLRMAEHALGELDPAKALETKSWMKAMALSMATLCCRGMCGQLDHKSVVGLGIRALQTCGALHIS